MELLIGTTNQGKFAEIQAYLGHLPMECLPLKVIHNYPTIVEDGATFEANALKKARTLAGFSGLATLADDSGLEVDALNGAPGIFSARYCGDESDDQKNNDKLLRELAQVPEHRRTARFVCVLAVCAPGPNGGTQWLVRRSCEGIIATKAEGKNGFGYDPLFFYPPLGRTFGEIDRESKATVSHRGKALKELVRMLPVWCGLDPKA